MTVAEDLCVIGVYVLISVCDDWRILNVHVLQKLSVAPVLELLSFLPRDCV